ncbi:hypothetical protein WJX79_000919 [Trebouxia sp. C0005]
MKVLTFSQQALLNRTYSKRLKRKAYPCRMSLLFLMGPGMAKLSLKISAALDLVPVNRRKLVEQAAGHAIGQGLLLECCKGGDAQVVPTSD